MTERLAKALARIRHLRGIRTIRWHALRHTFCTHLAMRGAPAKAIQAAAGHASLTTTLKYMHLAPRGKENEKAANPS